ncbi:MAG: lactate utilization protein C [Clostridia bacterium]|nr:lactate utilization protein C [Clostridia bacterium]
MITQQEFITNIALALGRKKPLTKGPPHKDLGPPAFWLEQNKYLDKKIELFKNNLEALTGRFALVKTPQDAREQLKNWLKELEAQEIICWDHPELKKTVQPEELGVTVHFWNKDIPREELIKICNQVKVGLTWADYGVAYTGTLVLFSQPHQGRAVSLLPDTHIAVLNSSQIVPTMSSVLQKIKSLAQMPSCINFITGPSRSADIEMDLSIGVHGPYKVWVIVVDR